MFFRTIRKYDLMSLSMTSQSLCSRAVNFLDMGTGWQWTKYQNNSRTYTACVRANSLYPPHPAGWQLDSSVGLKEKGSGWPHSRLPSSTCPSRHLSLPRAARRRGHLLQPTGAKEALSQGAAFQEHVIRSTHKSFMKLSKSTCNMLN